MSDGDVLLGLRSRRHLTGRRNRWPARKARERPWLSALGRPKTAEGRAPLFGRRSRIRHFAPTGRAGMGACADAPQTSEVRRTGHNFPDYCSCMWKLYRPPRSRHPLLVYPCPCQSLSHPTGRSHNAEPDRGCGAQPERRGRDRPLGRKTGMACRHMASNGVLSSFGHLRNSGFPRQ